MTTGSIVRVGLLTGGGDAPGLNAVIRAAVRAAAQTGIECVGLEDGFDGLAEGPRARRLTLADVTGIHRLGGTMLGTTSRGNPLGRPGPPSREAEEYATRCLENFRRLGLRAVVAIGGDGTLAIGYTLQQKGLPVVGVPKTIDNDIVETDMTFGFDSAVAFATEAIDRLHASAAAHHRTMVVEVMGRYTGWIGLHAAIAGGADIALIPEIPFRFERVVDRLRERERFGARCSIIVASEGASPVGGERTVAVKEVKGRAEKLGGIGQRVAETIEQMSGLEARFDVLGHLQRGGPPTSVDRVLATRFGAAAIDCVRQNTFGVMVALRGLALTTVPFDRVVGRTRPVPPGSDLLRTARAIGMSFGE